MVHEIYDDHDDYDGEDDNERGKMAADMAFFLNGVVTVVVTVVLLVFVLVVGYLVVRCDYFLYSLE
jgi:hypothetical protein